MVNPKYFKPIQKESNHEKLNEFRFRNCITPACKNHMTYYRQCSKRYTGLKLNLIFIKLNLKYNYSFKLNNNIITPWCNLLPSITSTMIVFNKKFSFSSL